MEGQERLDDVRRNEGVERLADVLGNVVEESVLILGLAARE